MVDGGGRWLVKTVVGWRGTVVDKDRLASRLIETGWRQD